MNLKTFFTFAFLTTSLSLHTCDNTDYDAIIEAANREASCSPSEREKAIASAPKDASEAYILGMTSSEKAFNALKKTHEALTKESASALFTAGMHSERAATDLVNTLITKKSPATIQVAIEKIYKAAEIATTAADEAKQLQ